MMTADQDHALRDMLKTFPVKKLAMFEWHQVCRGQCLCSECKLLISETRTKYWDALLRVRKPQEIQSAIALLRFDEEELRRMLEAFPEKLQRVNWIITEGYVRHLDMVRSETPVLVVYESAGQEMIGLASDPDPTPGVNPYFIVLVSEKYRRERRKRFPLLYEFHHVNDPYMYRYLLPSEKGPRQ